MIRRSAATSEDPAAVPAAPTGGDEPWPGLSGLRASDPYLKEATQEATYREATYQETPPATAAAGPRADFDSGGTAVGLPRRNPGAQLAPEVAEMPAKATVTVTVDPDAVRARLSAFAEGVSAAMRSGTLHS
jgi:hypothetical protein